MKVSIILQNIYLIIETPCFLEKPEATVSKEHQIQNHRLFLIQSRKSAKIYPTWLPVNISSKRNDLYFKENLYVSKDKGTYLKSNLGSLKC